MLTLADLDAFAHQVRRLRGAGEPPLYPAYRELIRAAYPTNYVVDSLLRVPSGGYPDFTVSYQKRVVNWIEVKNPTVHIDPLPDADQRRFDRYRSRLHHIVLTNGWHWRLFLNGEPSRAVILPKDWLLGSGSLDREATHQLTIFWDLVAKLVPRVAESEEEAVNLLAVAAKLIQEAVLDLDPSDYPRQLQVARSSFTELLRTNPADPSTLGPEEFADALAQTTTFGFLLARIETGADVDPGGAVGALNAIEHRFLKATLNGLMAPDPDLETAIRGVLITACDAVNRAAPRLTGPLGSWPKVTYVYEDFFAAYRPADRFKFGVFYTPENITRFQVREIRRLLQSDFGLAGLTDPAVRFLDPACGTGTYLVALAEEFEREAQELGLAVPAALQDLFAERVVGFEVSPGPACVAQARLAAWLRAHRIALGKRFPIYTVNTLTPPLAGGWRQTGNVWADNVAQEQSEGDRVKRDTPILVIFGNPPWGSRPRETFTIGERNIIEEWARGAQGAVINLYDLYVAFWRFACSMLLERDSVQEPRGIVSYISNRSWLRGKAYSGMRKWLRKQNVAATVQDLGGDVRAGARRDDEPVFDIKAGCAIGTLIFGGNSQTGGVRFTRLRGDRSSKLKQLDNETLPSSVMVSGSAGDPFASVDWGSLNDSPSIDAYFTCNWPGVKTHRDDLVIDVDRDFLIEKLSRWSLLREPAKSKQFHPSSTRHAPGPHYKIDPSLVTAHRYRPLDDRWLYADSLFIDRPGTISRLFAAIPSAPCLITMDSRTSAGPSVIAAATLPGYNSFRGSYETHVFPLVAMPGALLESSGQALARPAQRWATTFGATALDVGAYLLALGNAPSYAEAFSEALETDIVRFPATTDRDLFRAVVHVGRSLLDAWYLKISPTGRWKQVATGNPLGAATLAAGRICFENGDSLEEVHVRLADFSVSGYPVMRRYLEAREHLYLDMDLSERIRRVAGSIATLLDARETCNRLLAKVIASKTTPF